jgi:predicted transcriptional regulator
MRTDIKLTKTEENILTVLWDAGKPLAVSEICDHAQKIGVKLNHHSVQAVSRQLLGRNILKVGFITQINTVLARAFEPALTADELTLIRINQLLDSSTQKRTGLIATLLESENASNEDLDALIAAIEGLKKK